MTPMIPMQGTVNPQPQPVHPQPQPDTIVANASPPGVGAISVLRISGTQVPLIIQRFLHPIPSVATAGQGEHAERQDEKAQAEKGIPILLLPRYATLVQIKNSAHDFLDQAIAIHYVAPHSFTGEDVLELNVHGNLLLVQEILETLTSLDHVRLAQPGEFSKRAYLNHKLDLEQVQGIQQIISARSQVELIAGRKNLNGFYRRFISELRSNVIHLQAENAAEMDLPTEDLSFSAKQQKIAAAQELLQNIESLIEISRNTTEQTRGYRICLIGHTNVGKSSLFNQLLANTRAITSPQHGTTRDYLCEEVMIANTMVKLFDTAGLYYDHDHEHDTSDDTGDDTGDDFDQANANGHAAPAAPAAPAASANIGEVEKQGIALTKSLLQHSDLNILVSSVDEFRNMKFPDDSALLRTLPASGLNEEKRILYVINKSDLLQEHEQERLQQVKKWKHALLISCHQRTGIGELKQAIAKKLQLQVAAKDIALLGERETLALKKIALILKKIVLLWVQDAPSEIIDIEINNAKSHLAEVTKPIDNEEVLGRIFSLFCVGK